MELFSAFNILCIDCRGQCTIFIVKIYFPLLTLESSVA